MLRHACDVIGDPVLREGNFVFGDTDHHVRDLHRRRPVTKDKFPASWRLEDLATWLELPIPEQSHRAGADAKLTWEVLYHTMDRYGSDELLPRQQLVQRFFDEQGKPHDGLTPSATRPCGTTTGRTAATAASRSGAGLSSRTWDVRFLLSQEPFRVAAYVGHHDAFAREVLSMWGPTLDVFLVCGGQRQWPAFGAKVPQLVFHESCREYQSAPRSAATRVFAAASRSRRISAPTRSAAGRARRAAPGTTTPCAVARPRRATRPPAAPSAVRSHNATPAFSPVAHVITMIRCPRMRPPSRCSQALSWFVGRRVSP